MNVEQLMGYLADLTVAGHGKALVVMSKDAEGNGYRPFSGHHSAGRFFPDDGEYWSDLDFADPENDEYLPNDLTRSQRAVVLWPVD